VVQVTERAAQQLYTLLKSETSDPDAGFRVIPAGGGQVFLFVDRETSADYVVEFRGSKVLLVGVEYLKPFQDVVIDCRDVEGKTSLYAIRRSSGESQP
jgi:Fe-S cluster assembly iron-binding protein IscA